MNKPRLIVSYDISDDKLRTKFAKFLSGYGGRLQYSIFEIRNSTRVLEIIQVTIAEVFAKKFTERDSVMIFQLSATCKIERYGYAKHEETDLLIF